jgi:hypothetical protein
MLLQYHNLSMARRWNYTSILIFVYCGLPFLSFLKPVYSASETPSTRDEVVASFQSWVDRVGAASKKAAKPALDNHSLKDGETISEWVIVVDQHGGGNYTTVNEAINAVPPHNKDPITIKINPGTYT